MRWAGSGLAGLMSAVALLAALEGCGAVHKGDEQIQSTARELYAAMGLSDSIVEYGYEVRQKDLTCANELHIDPENAWWARRAYAVGAKEGRGPLNPAELYSLAVSHLRGTGWTVQEFDGEFGGAPAFNAVRDDASLLYYGADTQFAVTVGPCAPSFTGPSAPQYSPVPRGSFTTPHAPKPPLRAPRSTSAG
jgi:hypothetical protein